MSEFNVDMAGSPVSFDERVPGKSSVDAASSETSARAEWEDGGGAAKKTKILPAVGAGDTALTINPRYTTAGFESAVALLLKAWREGSTPSTGDVQPALSFVFRKPFPHLVFPNFFQGPVDALEEELLAQKFTLISTDLMQLSQTRELSHKKVTEFADLTATFRNDVRPWVESITNINLSEDVDIRGAKYGFTDRLVCHDDRLTSRKVAYVYYLTDPSWSADDGGSLDLFDSSCMNDVVIPGSLEKSITPARNTLVLFVVGDDSFHQVSEVLSTKKTRLSITGWFHAKSAPGPARIIYQEHSDILHFDVYEAKKEESDICFLANADDDYSLTRKLECARDLKKNQACSVRNVMADEFYRAVVDELRLKDSTFPWLTPPNRNQGGWYQYVNVSTQQQWSKDMPFLTLLLGIVTTDIFLHSLEEITGLTVSRLPLADVHKVLPVTQKKTSSLTNGSASVAKEISLPPLERWVVELVQFRLERFEHRSYTLKTYEAVQMDDVIDVFYFIDCDRLDSDCGGGVFVVDANEDTEDWDPIVSLDGESNGCLIVRRDKDMVVFTEYLNHRWARRNGDRPFYRLWLSFPAEDIIEPTRVTGKRPRSPSESDVDNSDDSDLVEPDEADAALSGSDEDDDEEDD